MRYEYSAAWVVIGGISLRANVQTVKLTESEDSHFILVRDPDPFLTKVDLGWAISRLMLRGAVGEDVGKDRSASIAAEIERIRAERKKMIRDRPVLLFQARGEVDARIKEPYYEHDDYIVVFDAVEKGKVRQLHQAEIAAMKAALALEGTNAPRFSNLVERAFLLTDTGKVVHSISFSASGDISVATSISEGAIEQISHLYKSITSIEDLNSVVRLFSQMTEHGIDRFRSFLFGWTALEILISKSFKNYEMTFLSPLTQAAQPTLRGKFLDRIRSVMKDKYRLADKFLAVATVVLPTAGEEELQEDFEKFRRIKEVRDKISHGEIFSERDLPVHELASLLRKYLLARVTADVSTCRP